MGKETAGGLYAVGKKNKEEADADLEKELFCKFYKEHVTEKNANTMLVDLTSDGTEEMILVDFGKQTRQEFLEQAEYATLYIVDIIDNQAVVLYQDEFSWFTTMGYRWYYLYEMEGKKCLYQFINAISSGAGYYEYEVFGFDMNGNRTVYKHNRADYQAIFPGTDLEKETEKLKQITEEALKYEEHAVPLIRAGERMFRENVLEEGERYEKYVFDKEDLVIKDEYD